MAKNPFFLTDWVPDPGVENLVYETPWLDFYYDDITHPDGESGKYAWIQNHSGNGAVMVIPVTPSGRFLLIKVYRHPSKKFLWEFPAGVMESGESPLGAGRRELVEETGIVAKDIRVLGSQTPVAGYTGNVFHSLLAEIPETTIEDIALQSEEGIVDAVLLLQEELFDLVKGEEITDGVTLACLARYWMHQKNKASDGESQGEA